MTSATERYHAFKLQHLDHPKGELIHYVGSPCSVEEIEQRLGGKNKVTHVFERQQWKRLAKA